MAIQVDLLQADAGSSRILVVESEGHTADMARRCLARHGFCVRVANSGREAMPWIARSWADLVVLDPRLPEDAGTCFFSRLRAVSDVPVVMISPRADDHDRIWGLQLGADDFVPNPLAPDELVARVRCVLRRAPSRGEARDVHLPGAGPLVLDEAARRVRARGVWVVLTALEFRLLRFLTDNPGRTFSREELLEAVWGYTIGDTSTVTVHVRRLREKIEPDPAHPASILTVWGVGYRFESSGGRSD